MSEILFKSACPAAGCTDTKTYTWYHNGCPSWSDEYLSDQAMIRCTYCGKKWEFFSSKFECDYRNNKMEKAFLRKVLFCLAALEDAQLLSVDFYQKIKKSMKDQAEKYGCDK
jgi:hypothetical protein